MPLRPFSHDKDLHFPSLYLTSAFFFSLLSVSPQLLKHHTALTLSQAKAYLCLCARGCFTDTWALSSDVKWDGGFSLSATRLAAPLAPLITSSTFFSNQRLVWSLLKRKQPLKHTKRRKEEGKKNNQWKWSLTELLNFKVTVPTSAAALTRNVMSAAWTRTSAN